MRPEAVPGSASTRPNRDGAAGGSQSKCALFGAKHRAEERIFSALKLETLLMFSAATGGPIQVWHCSHRPKHRLRPGTAAHGPSTSCWAARASARPLGAPTEALGLPVAPAVVTRGDQVLIRPSLTLERLGLRGAA